MSRFAIPRRSRSDPTLTASSAFKSAMNRPNSGDRHRNTHGAQTPGRPASALHGLIQPRARVPVSATIQPRPYFAWWYVWLISAASGNTPSRALGLPPHHQGPGQPGPVYAPDVATCCRVAHRCRTRLPDTPVPRLRRLMNGEDVRIVQRGGDDRLLLEPAPRNVPLSRILIATRR